MFKNRKISEKLGMGFGTILIFTVAVTWFGWNALTEVSDRVEKGDDVNRLVKYIYQARLNEKNFISREDDIYIKDLRQNVAEFIAQARETKDKSKDELNQAQMDEVIDNVTQYEAAFLEYVSFAKKREEAMANMKQEARKVLDEAGDIRLVQKEQLANIRTQSDVFIKDKIAKADDANRLLKLALDAKSLQMALMAHEDADKLGQWKQINQDIMDLTNNLKARFKLQNNIDQADAILASYRKYQLFFLEYLKNRRSLKTQQTESRQNLVVAATEAMTQMQAIHADQKAQLTARLAENEARINDKLAKSHEANRIVKLFLDARKNEKEFLLSGEQKYIEFVDKALEKSTKIAKELTAKFKYDKNVQQGKQVIDSLKEYYQAFKHYVAITQENHRQQDDTMKAMRRAASVALAQAEDIRAVQTNQLKNIRNQAAEILDDKMAKANDANRLLKWALDAKALRVALVTQKDADKLAKWKQINKDIIDLTNNLKARFKLPKNLEQADAILTRYGKYQQLFLDYLQSKQQDKLDAMIVAAGEAMAQILAISADQKAQLTARLAENDARINDKLAKADDANRIIKLYLNARKNEKEVIISGEQKYLELVNQDIEKAMTLAKELTVRFTLEKNVQQGKRVIGSLEDYDKAFKHYVAISQENRRQQDNTMKEMKQAAKIALEQAEAIRADQKSQLETIRVQAAEFLDDKITKADDANRLLKWALDAKVLRVALVAQADADKLAKWQQINKNIIVLTNSLKARFKRQENVAQADAILTSYARYQQIFRQSLQNQHEMEKRQQQELDLVRTAAQSAREQMLAIIRTDQKSLLTAKLKENNNNINDKQAKADEANRIVKWYLETRKNEKQFIISHDHKYVEMVNQSLENLLQLAKKLMAKFKRDKNIKQSQKVIRALEAYSEAFQHYVSLFHLQQEKEQSMIEIARYAQEVNQAAIANQKQKMASEINLAGKLFTVISMIAVIFGILVAFFVTRSIVRPLASAVNLANQLAVGKLSARVDTSNSKDEISQLLNAMNDMSVQFQNVIEEVNEAFGKLAKGNMNARIAVEFVGDFAEIKQATNGMAQDFQAVISETTKVLGQLSKGNMATRITRDYPGDFAEIKQAANAMAQDLQSVISETSKILGQLSGGDMRVQITGEFVGDFEKVKNALETTAHQLADATAKNAIQDWLKTGQTQLSEQVSGEQDVITLSKNIITFLTTYLEAQVGVFYLLEEVERFEAETEQEDNTTSAHLKLIASYAYTQRKGVANEISVGEGLVGQAALEKQRIIVTEVPENYIHIQSGLGETVPRNLLVIPFMYEKAVKGVIEIGSVHEVTEVQLELLEQVMPNIGIAVNTAESRTKMQALLSMNREQ